ncbi:uncharacterized protein LOC127104265 [Lathyrus oleraceus]|uniref:uncharacterized protein LOC127104265 n=1 Tax=Pisum sativum TaxID=3888 RepID=UPI0021D3DA40|nr:uncharacterized protein LOC127104265 [Pisum sativum]
MAKSSSPPSFHKFRNSNKDKQQRSSEYDEKRRHVYKCEFCPKVFSTGQALGGHKTCHRSNKQQIHDDKAHKTIKITFSLSCSPSYPNNHDAKLKRHSWTRVFKGTVHDPPAALKPLQQEELPAVDLVSLLPPRSYNTKKRSRRYLIHDGVSNNIAPIPSLDMSRESVNLDLNRSEYKRMKIPSNGNDNVLLTRRYVEREVRPRVVRDFDLNELPTNDVADEIIDHE